ncbi:MAG: hypothetical protein KAS77_07800, partial [Thermoplasmata archaeon]|nr:hypothetical protein [Thermoplasmata archaeon]
MSHGAEDSGEGSLYERMHGLFPSRGVFHPSTFISLTGLCLLMTLTAFFAIGCEAQEGYLNLSNDLNMGVSDMDTEGDEIYMVAEQRNPGDRGVHLRHFDGARWNPWERVNVLEMTGYGGPSIAVANGKAHIVWTMKTVTGENLIHYRMFYDGRWGQEVILAPDTGTGDEHKLFSDVPAQGDEVHVVWTDFKYV